MSGLSAFNLWRTRKFFLSCCETDRWLQSGLDGDPATATPKLATVLPVLDVPTDGSASSRASRRTAGREFKDHYILEFLGLEDEHTERQLRKAILANLRDFFLEFGRDLTLVGEEYLRTIDADAFRIDLLLRLRKVCVDPLPDCVGSGVGIQNGLEIAKGNGKLLTIRRPAQRFAEELNRHLDPGYETVELPILDREVQPGLRSDLGGSVIRLDFIQEEVVQAMIFSGCPSRAAIQERECSCVSSLSSAADLLCTNRTASRIARISPAESRSPAGAFFCST
jgi:hypothetical protein